jgi:Ca2+-binding EF-hand superfamily protein
LAAADVQNLMFLGPMRPLVLRLHITIDGKPFRQAWQERFAELFALEDRDHDGRVSVEEGESIARDMNGGLRENRPVDVKSVAGADGLVDRATLMAYIEKVLPQFSVRRRSSVARDSALALFPLLDTDHNRQLSAAELSAAEEQLKQRDFNDDRVVTAGELIVDPKAVAAAADPNSADRDLKEDEGTVFPLESATTPEAIAERIMKHYDRNHDGRLTTKAPEIEIALPAALMGRFDANGDGMLDRDELLAFADRPADLELSFPMGRASASDIRARPRPVADPTFRVRKKTNDGGYDLKLGEAEIIFRRNNRDPQQADLVELRGYDRDNNGYIDAAEAANSNIAKSTFAAMDGDGDGKVFKGEFTSFMGRQNAAAAVRFQLEVTDKGQDLFDVLDTDKDGVLSPRELRTAKDVLAVGDKNGDGSLNGDEVPQKIELELVRGVDERAESDNAGLGRAARSTSKAGTSGPLWFRKMDRNNDGDLSVHEFVGPLETFKKIDANHDGFIDRDEAEAAGK